ncbi:MAG: hypothetical protein HY737_00260 [Candidatus Omnitrophica bacterium]|nr:hypothetical protein [Candidatus Omnitrophota bacterium]
MKQALSALASPVRLGIYILLTTSSLWYGTAVAWAEDVFEVKCVATDSTFYRRGKIEKDKAGDEVTYLVNISKGTVTRTAVYNKNLPQDQGGGLQSDNSTYQIVQDWHDPLLKQRVIKAIGQVAAFGGYETIVIGEDFVTTSKSATDYFTLYTYKRINQ